MFSSVLLRKVMFITVELITSMCLTCVKLASVRLVMWLLTMRIVSNEQFVACTLLALKSIHVMSLAVTLWIWQWRKSASGLSASKRRCSCVEWTISKQVASTIQKSQEEAEAQKRVTCISLVFKAVLTGYYCWKHKLLACRVLLVSKHGTSRRTQGRCWADLYSAGRWNPDESFKFAPCIIS